LERLGLLFSLDFLLFFGLGFRIALGSGLRSRDAGFEGGGVCCAAAGKESKIAKATNCRVANSIGKHPSKCRDNEALR